MKKCMYLLTLIGFLFVFQGCNSDLDDCCGTDDPQQGEIRDANPDNDPLSLGIENCYWTEDVLGKSIDYRIKYDIPRIYDLGYLMPEPASQGRQGSCASWATHYYLGTYMHNIATDSIIAGDQEIMSPAFSFNQLKLGSGNCNGSYISQNLGILRDQGGLALSEFEYTDSSCDRQPNAAEQALATRNIITSHETIGPYEEINDNGQSVIAPILEEVKTAVLDGHPIVITMLVDEQFGKFYQGDVFIVNQVERESFRGCHAMTIVGYNDDIGAVRVVNSWGPRWANQGYVYVSYDFFKGSEDPDFEIGVLSLAVAFND